VSNVVRIRDRVDESIFRQILNISANAFNDLSSDDILMLPIKQDIRNTPYMITEVCEKLNDLSRAVDGIKCTDIYYSQGNLLLRDGHAFFLDDYGEDNRYPSWLLEIIKSTQNDVWKNVGDEHTAFVYVRKYPYYSQTPKAVLMIEVKASALINEIEKIRSVDNGFLGLVTEYGEMIAILQTDNILWSETGLAERISEMQEDGFFEYKIGKKKYIVAYAVSDYSEWKYFSIVPAESVFSGRVSLMLKVSCFGILYTLVSLAATVFITKKANNPMEDILNNMEDYIGNESFGLESNQYELIEKTFSSLTACVENLEEHRKQIIIIMPVRWSECFA